jgi:putative FmdB family regulatory protein
MPVYDYTCAACGRRFEVFHGVHAEGPTSCPLCGSGPVRKAITAAAVHYRGSGWAKKERRAAASGKAAGEPVAAEAGGKDEASTKGDGGSTEGAGAGQGAATGATGAGKAKPARTARTGPTAPGD